MDVKEIGILGSSVQMHWYYRSKAKMLHQLLGSRRFQTVIDVGAGSGFFSRMLLDSGAVQRAICVDPAYDPATLASSTPAFRYVHGLDAHERGDLMLFMDVLEHVDHPTQLLQDYVSYLAPGAMIVCTVPAFQWLWSSHDDFLDHRRRYTLRELEEQVSSVGLEDVHGRYFFGLLFPAVAAMRMVERLQSRRGEPRSALRSTRPWLNAVLERVHDFERLAVFPVNRFAGVSAVCAATVGDLGRREGAKP